MLWLDVTGPPGVGKSTLCDADWPPNAIKWDGLPLPEGWQEFIACAERLQEEVADHPSAGACRSMMQRSFRKMATVSRLKGAGVYIQTGLAQRGLGLGWRLRDPELVAEYYRLMPVSVGVAVLVADVETIQRRNVERGKDRSFMVPLMVRPREILVEVLKERGVPLLELDMTLPPDENRKALREFACRRS